MRVAFVCSSLYRYNVEMFRLASQTPDFHVSVLQMVERDRFREWRFSLDGVETKTIGSVGIPLKTYSAGPETIHFNPALWRELRDGRYDVFVTMSWTQGYTLLTLAAARWWRKPVILWEMSVPHPVSPLKRMSMSAIRLLMRSYDGYTAGSSKCKTYLTTLGCEPAKIHLVRHAIDYEFFAQHPTLSEKNQSRRELGLPVGLPIVLFVGQYIKRKGLVELLSAWQALQANHSFPAHLVLLGSGELEAYIQEFVATHHLNHAVTVKGYVQHDELKKWYGAADLFVMPSRYEAFGAVAGEALSSGLPVITTTVVGAEPDLVREGVNGIIVPPGDVASLQKALEQLVLDTTLRGRLSCGAHTVAKEYATPGIAAEFVNAVTLVSQARSAK